MPAACRNRRAAQRSCDSLPTLEDALHLGEHETADGDVRELTPLDLDGNPRFTDDPATLGMGCGVPIPFAVDMGAFEFLGLVASNAIYVGDLDADRVVGIVDFLALLANWGPADMCLVADLDFDGEVGITDFLLLLADWGPSGG